jgi:S-methylmethionine-dependent homocysteine/selenocysteine methylase
VYEGVRVIIMDGPMGSLLAARGVCTDSPAWSAEAIVTDPRAIARVHSEYAEAGANVHTANTFRTRERQLGAEWRRMTRLAAHIARSAAPAGACVAGSLGPIEDCYRPDLSPRDPRPEHRRMARELAAAGVDLLLCETFPLVREALVAVEESASTGVPVWASFTAGPDGSLLTPAEMAAGAKSAVSAGASAVLVNCVGARLVRPYVEALGTAGVPFGAYANSGEDAAEFNRHLDDARAVDDYVARARSWVEAGATIVGSCCGTGPKFIRALAETFLPSIRGPNV